VVESDNEEDCVLISDLPCNNSGTRQPGNRKNKINYDTKQRKDYNLLEKKALKFAKKHRDGEPIAVLDLDEDERQLFNNSFDLLLKNFREQRVQQHSKLSRRQRKRRQRELHKQKARMLMSLQGAGQPGEKQLKRQLQEANPTNVLKSVGAVRVVPRRTSHSSRNSGQLCPLSQSFRQFFDLTDTREETEELPTWRQLEQENNECLEMIPRGKQRKIGENNIGYRLLVANGWNGKSGLGRYEQGIENPIVPTVVQGRHGLYSHSEAWK
jgi:hypothetical protein